MVDNVNSPSHYTKGPEAINVIEAKLTKDQYQGMLLGNVLKYTMRCNYKGKFEEDIKKAQWYLNRLVNTFGTDELELERMMEDPHKIERMDKIVDRKYGLDK